MGGNTMICKLKNLTLLVGALLVLGGLMASAASAAPVFTAEKVPATLTGVQDGPYKIEATGLAIECKSVAMHGTVEKTVVESVKIVPLLSECSAFGFAATITGFSEGGCHLVLYSKGTGDLVCPAGKEVTLVAGTCTVHMPPQTGVKTITFTNSEREGKSALTVDMALDNLHGTHTDGFVCPFNGGGTFTGTKASGVGQVWGENGFGEPIGISWDA
jgi:hypothetical protein